VFNDPITLVDRTGFWGEESTGIYEGYYSDYTVGSGISDWLFAFGASILNGIFGGSSANPYSAYSTDLGRSGLGGPLINPAQSFASVGYRGAFQSNQSTVQAAQPGNVPVGGAVPEVVGTARESASFKEMQRSGEKDWLERDLEDLAYYKSYECWQRTPGECEALAKPLEGKLSLFRSAMGGGPGYIMAAHAFAPQIGAKLGGNIGALFSNPEISAPHIGAAPRLGGKKMAPFNGAEGTSIGKNNCVQCVTALVDAIENGSFVKSGAGYPAAINEGVISRALKYITEQTRVTFGKQQQNRMSGATDFVIFTDIDLMTNKSNHVIFGSVRGGSPYFYDPQTGVKSYGDPGDYFSYPIIYTDGEK
jgi:hypothetical protein